MIDLTMFLIERITQDELLGQTLLQVDAFLIANGENADRSEALSPARLLAECAAKRRIIELHHPTSENRAYSLRGSPDTCAVCIGFHADMDCENAPWPCETLRILAQPYSAHPDFDESWTSQ